MLHSWGPFFDQDRLKKQRILQIYTNRIVKQTQ